MMRDRLQDPMNYSPTTGSTGLSTFLLGAAAGAAVALLLAPAEGRRNREWLKDNARRLRDGAEDRLGSARHALEDGASTVKNVVETGKEVVRESVTAGREALGKAREATSTGTTGTSSYGGTTASTTSRTP
jgi:gas vesicle protein